MKIGVDFQSTEGRVSGIGVFAKNLFEAIAAEKTPLDFIFYKTGSKKDLNVPSRIRWESWEIPRRARKDGVSMIYSPGFSPSPNAAVPRVVTVHDLIGLAMPSNQGIVSSFYWSVWQPFALKKAQRLVASSDSTRRDIVRFLKIPEKKISVVRLSAAPVYRPTGDTPAVRATCKKYGLDRPFFITVGTLEPRKNHIRLLEAYAALARAGRTTFLLAVVGKDAGTGAMLRRYAAENGIESGVRFIGYASEGELVELYNGSLGYAAPSLYEGFGYPVLEAMSCGKSGICSSRSSLPEIAGDTSILVDPADAGALARALYDYASDDKLRRDLSGAALRRAAEFSPRRTAREMLRVFGEVGA